MNSDRREYGSIRFRRDSRASGLKDFELLLNEAAQKAPIGELVEIMEVGAVWAYLALKVCPENA